MWFMYALIILGLSMIVYQDLKYREVYWFLFPVVGLGLGYLHSAKVFMVNFWSAILMNMVVVGCVMLLLYLYTKLKLRRKFFDEVFGWGDVLIFIVLAIGFPTGTFIILFVFALCFSLVISLLFQGWSGKKTVPLAGYMSLFLILMLLVDQLSALTNLYLV